MHTAVKVIIYIIQIAWTICKLGMCNYADADIFEAPLACANSHEF